MLLSLLQNRRSTRTFKKETIEAEKVDQLIEAMLRAPSSREIYPWDFIVIDDKELLLSLSQSKPKGSTFLKGAALGIAVCAQPGQSDAWVEDCAISATYIQLVAESIGLGSCWIQIRNRPHDDQQTAQEYVSKVLKLPTSLEVLSIVAVGYKKGVFPPHGEDTLKKDRVHRNRFGEEYY